MRHWTDDEEILEQYVLRRLSPERQRECDYHLQSCPHCQENLQAEAFLRDVVRSYGRSELKNRMRREIEARVVHPISVRRIVAIAAAIVVTLTAGITGIWVMRQRSEVSAPSRQEITHAIAPEELETAKEKGFGLPGSVSDRKPELPARTPSGSNLERQSSPSTIAPETPGHGLTGTVSSGAAKRPVVPGTGGAVAAALPQRRKASAEGGSTSLAFATDSTWVDGTSLRAEAPADDRESRPLLKAESKSPEEASIVLKQQQVSALHEQSPALRGDVATGRLRIQLKKSGSTLLLTLFVQKLFDEEELRQARVETLGADSLIIDIRSTRIGCKLPAGWTIPLNHTTRPE